MAVDGIAGAEHPPLGVVLGVEVIDRPGRRRGDGDRYGVVTDQPAHDRQGELVGEVRRGALDVVAPDDQPPVPRSDHADEPCADAAHVRTGLEHPVEDRGSVGNEMRQVRLEDDVDRPANTHPTSQRQADVIGHLRPAAVRSDDVAGPDLVVVPPEPVPDLYGYAVLILTEAEVLGVEPGLGAPGLGGVEQDRLHQVLRQVADLRGAGGKVARQTVRPGTPRVQATELLAGQRGAVHQVPHQGL